MRCVQCLTAAIVIAAAVAGVGVRAGELQDARAQAWFWGLPDDNPRPQPFATRVLDPKPKRYAKPFLATKQRDAKWFWSFTTKKVRATKKARPETERGLYFYGADVWRQGAFLYGGMLWAPAGLASDGVVFKLIATRGAYRYRSGVLGDASVTGLMTAATIMPGLHFTRGGVSATVYAGLDYQVHLLSPDDPGNAARGRHIGVRTAVDLWMSRPRPPC